MIDAKRLGTVLHISEESVKAAVEYGLILPPCLSNKVTGEMCWRSSQANKAIREYRSYRVEQAYKNEEQITKLYRAGGTLRGLAKQYNVSQYIIRSIIPRQYHRAVKLKGNPELINPNGYELAHHAFNLTLSRK